MNRLVFVVVGLLAVSVFSSCEVEFSPNDQWRETPVVYCLLDQDEDTSYVRVQRCFLGEGNQYVYAAEPDSLYYPQGSIAVFVEEWDCWTDRNGVTHRSGSAPRRVFNFDYRLMSDKDTGVFFNAFQPVYACHTGGMLDTNRLYRLRVVKTATGDTIASSETRLIRGNMTLTHPNNVTLFQFAGTSGSKTCLFAWSSLREARQYQPIVRFWYRDFTIDYNTWPWDTIISRHYIDIPCNVVKSNMRDPSLNTRLDQNYFLSVIRSALEHDSCNRNIIDTVDIFITCCSEPLAAYIYAGNPAGSLNQDPFTYSNIDGGLGVFAARRRHIVFRVGTPVSAVSNYVKSLKELGVGF